MFPRIAALLAASVFALSASGPASAGRFGGFHGGGPHFSHFGGFHHFAPAPFHRRVFVGGALFVPFAFPPPAYYGPPAYYAPPEEYYPPPAQYVEPSAPQSSYWYYCPDSRAYYPYVKQCPGGWQQVAPQPPS